MQSFDPITLKILWDRLVSLAWPVQRWWARTLLGSVRRLFRLEFDVEGTKKGRQVEVYLRKRGKRWVVVGAVIELLDEPDVVVGDGD